MAGAGGLTDFEEVEWGEVGLQKDQQAKEGDEGEAVAKDEAEDVAFFSIALGGGAGDDDALGVDHFSHDATGAISGTHEDGAKAELLSGDGLEGAEEDVGGGVGAGEGDAQPAEKRSEEGVEDAGIGEGEAEGGIGA